jgi:hypothetical protein
MHGLMNAKSKENLIGYVSMNRIKLAEDCAKNGV